jgi:hypothetical protein
LLSCAERILPSVIGRCPLLTLVAPFGLAAAMLDAGVFHAMRRED